MATCIEVVIPNNTDNRDLPKDEVVSSTSLFEVNRLASLNCKGYEKGDSRNSVLWSNYSKNLVVAVGDSVTSLRVGENITEIFNKKIPGEHSLRAVANLPSSHIIVGVSSDNKIIFYDGINERIAELSVEVPPYVHPNIYCHRWRDHTYVIISGKGVEKTVWVALTGHISIYEKSSDLSEAIDNGSTSGITNFSLFGSVIAFNPESNLLYAFTKDPGSFNRYYRLTTEGIYIHREAYSEKGYLSVTMTPTFAFALSTDGYLDIFELRMLVLYKEILLVSENTKGCEKVHGMQVTATSKTCSLEGLYMLISVSTGDKHQLQIRLVQTNEIVCSVDCNEDSAFLRLDSALDLMSFVEISNGQITLKAITEATPDLKIEKLISMKKFSEALEMAKKFSVSFDPIYKAQVSDLLENLRGSNSDDTNIPTLYTILKKIKNQDVFCDLCLEGILSLNMFNVVRKLLDMALDTRSKNPYIVEQLNSISENFTTSRMIFTSEEFAGKWLSIVGEHTSMYFLLLDAIREGIYKRAEIIWNRHILKSEFNRNVTNQSTLDIIEIFSLYALDKSVRPDAMRFMEKSFMPYVLMKFGGEIGCVYAKALIQVITDLEDVESDSYPSIAYDISLSFDRISKALKDKILTPGEKCLFVNIRTEMGYDSFSDTDVLGKLNVLKENLVRLVNIQQRFNLSFEYKKFVELTNEDIGIQIIEKMLIKETEFEIIYAGVFKPYCEEFVMDSKTLICNFVQKWSAQQTIYTGDAQLGFLKNKVGCICKLIGKIGDPVLQIKCLQHLADAVPFNWPRELTQSVYSILVDSNIAKDVKATLADRCKLAEICHIVKIYKDVPYDIEETIRHGNQFEHLLQSISVNASSVDAEVLAKDVMKLCQLRHSYCKLPGTFDVTYTYIYEQLWMPYLIQWRFSGFEKKEPMTWLYSLSNLEAQEAIARYSVDYLLDLYKRGRQNLKTSEEISRYLKTLSIIKSFILNYLSKVKKYQLILDKIQSVESLYRRFKILKSPTFFLESPKESSNFMSELITTYGIDDWEKLLEIAKITKMDNVAAHRHLLNACLENSHLLQASAILFTISLDRDSLTSEMMSMIKLVLDGIFLKIHEISNERSFNLTNFVNMLMLALKVFMAEADGLDTSNFDDLLEFSRYHKFLNVVKDIIDSTDSCDLSNDTTEAMDTSGVAVKEIITWEIHPLAHLQQTSKAKYHITLNRRSKPFTRSCLQLPMNGENNLEILLSVAGSIVENDEFDQIKTRDYIDGWRNLFNQLLMDGQFFDVFNLLEIYKTIPVLQNQDIDVERIIKLSTNGLLEKILLIPDCDLELATALISSIYEQNITPILQELHNQIKTNANPRVYINFCELLSMVYHKITQVGILGMLTKKYDDCLWKRKLSKFGFNYSNNMSLNEVISSLVKCNVPHDIAHEYCIYNDIDLNSFRLQCALESCLYSSELLEMNDTAKHAEQIKRSSTLLSIVTITQEYFPQVQDAIMKISPYNHEGILLLIDKALQSTKDDHISDNYKRIIYDWKIVVEFVISYGKRNSEILPIECNWLSTLRSSTPNNGVLSSTSIASGDSNQSIGDMSMIEYEAIEEKREAARKRMPQCAVQRLPFHLLCSTDENEIKKFVCPVVFNEINIHNAYRWVHLIVNTESVLRLSQSECIFTAINKRVKYVDDNNIFVGDVDKDWILSAIEAVDISKVSTIIKYCYKYTLNLKNLAIKIAYLNILKEIASTTSELDGGKKKELLEYEKEISKRIIKYSVEKVLSDNRLLDEDSKEYLSKGNVPEMIRYMYSNSIDWNNYQDRTTKMEACKEIVKITGVNLSSIHSTIIDGLLVQETLTQVGDPDATLNISADMVLPVNQGVDNRLECDILDDDANVSKIVHILCTGDYSSMVKKMFGILNKDPKTLPGGITTLIKIIICICRLYPRKGEKPECFKAKKSQVLIALKGAYYYHMLSTINVNCKMIDLMNENKVLEILKQLQNSPVHSTEKDFVIVNIVRDYLKKSNDYYLYMKTYIPRMIMGRQFSISCCILNDSSAPLTSDHMGCNILQFVLKTIEGILKQNIGNVEVAEDMLRFMMKYSISSGYSRPPRETGLFSGNQNMSKVAHYILNPTGN